MKGNYKKRINYENNENLNENEKCCNDPSIESREGSLVCINCGLVKGRDIVENERRAFNFEEIEKRKQTEPRWREFGPRTLLPKTETDSKGHVLNAKGKTLFSRLSKIQNSLISSIERNFWEAKPKLNMLASRMNVPVHIKETAWKIYSIVAQKKLTMGRSIEGFVAAALYAAIRVHEFPRLLEEVCDGLMTPRRTVHRSLGIIVKDVLHELDLRYRPITAEQLIFRFGNDLEFPMETQKIALNLLTKASKNGLVRVGKDPKGLAASVLYLAARDTNYRRTQSEMSYVAKITEVTLRNRVKDIRKALI
jgi:transcription initiation factor TFIIB